jgi:hypothetical protein
VPLTYIEDFRRTGSDDRKTETAAPLMDAAEFAKVRLGFDADDRQREMLRSKASAGF